MNARRVHVYLSSNLWDGLWIIQQPIAQEIARTEPLLYVERQVSIFTIARYRRLWKRAFAWLRGARWVQPNIWVLPSLPLFHLGHRFPRLYRLDLEVQRLWIRFWAGRVLPHATRVLWMDLPMYESLVGRLGDSVSVYHLGDEITAFADSDARIMRILEQRMLKRVDIVFAAAEQLARDKAREHHEVHTVWNAIDPAVFDGAARDGLLSGVPAPRVAFVGVIDQWVDMELLASVASRLPRVQFVIVGPPNGQSAALSGLSNVHLLGRQPRTAVPSLLRECSASIIPFKRSLLTERLVPLKAFEALAAGIIPIATDFSPDLHRLASLQYLRIANDANEFIRAINDAIRADTPEERARLSQFGLRQTWSARWAEMEPVIARAVARRALVGPPPAA